MMTKTKQLLLENTMWVYVAKIVTQAIGLLASVLVLRQLEVDVYGTYVFLFGLFVGFQLLIISPLKQVLLRFIPELRPKISGQNMLVLLLQIMLLALTMVVTLTIFFFLNRDYIATLFNIESFDDYLIPFLIFIITYSIKLLLEVLMTTFLLHRKIAILNIWIVTIRATLYIILLQSLTVNYLLLIEGVVSVLYSIPALLSVYVGIKRSTEIVNNKLPLYKKRIRKFWIYSFFTEVGAGLIGRTSDYYIIAAFSNPYFMGLYGFAIKIYEIFYKLVPIREMESVLKPLFFARYASASSDEELNQFFNFTLKALVPLFIFPFLFFTVFGKVLIIEVFGVKYIESYWTAVILLLGIIVNGFFYPLLMIIQLREKLQLLLYSNIIVILSLIAGIIMMKHYGIIGVAIASVLGEFIKHVFIFFMFNSFCKLSYSWKMLKSYLGIIAFVLVVYMPFQFLYSNLILASVAMILFFISYLLYLINFHPLDHEELKQLNDLLLSSKKLKPLLSVVSQKVGKLRFIK